MTTLDLFDEFARVATERHRVTLSDLERLTTELLPGESGARTFLARPLNYASAEALSSYSTVFLSEQLLVSAPRAIREAVALHEVVHLLLGREVARTLHHAHPDVTRGLHDTIIPAWLTGDATIRADTAYASEKGWRQFYAAWTGPTSVKAEHACEAAVMYFTLLKEGLVFVDKDRVHSLSPLARGLGKPRGRESNRDTKIAQQSEILCIATGLELVQYLDECLSATLASVHQMDLATWEEAFANYAATLLTGVSLKDMQEWAPQDQEKLRRAARLCEAKPSIAKLRGGTMTYDDLVAVVREIGPSPRA